LAQTQSQTIKNQKKQQKQNKEKKILGNEINLFSTITILLDAKVFFQKQ
jgi:hypothetical protein